jgi:polar amino acid transport system substrate-binding protein
MDRHSPTPSSRAPAPRSCSLAATFLCLLACARPAEAPPSAPDAGLPPAAPAPAQTDLPEVHGYSDDSPPYNFSAEGGPRGISADLLRAICQEAQLRCTLEILPWARAFYKASTEPNTVIFTTTRSPEREALFLWIGPFLQRSEWIIGKAGGPTPRSLADLARFRIGVINEDAAIDDLRKAGVPAEAIDLAGSAVINHRKLQAGRVDFTTGTVFGTAWEMKQQGLAPRSLRRVLPLAQEGGYYFALNPKSNPEVVRRLREGFARAEQKKVREALVTKYLGEVSMVGEPPK